MRKEARLAVPDIGVLAAVIVLLIAGMLLVFDASYGKMGDAKWANYDIWYMLKRQFMFAAIGIALMCLVMQVRFQSLIKWTAPLLLVSIALLIAVLIPGVGHKVNGAYRWIPIGPFNLQPSEIAKVALVMYLGGIFARRKLLVRRINGDWTAPVFVVATITGLIFIEPDLGTAITIVFACFIMLYASGAKKRHLFGIAAGGCGLAGLAVLFEPYRLQRIWVWLNPWRDPYGDGYQVIHSLLALGTGGLTGVGLCEGREKLYIPAASTDFIMATLGEEAGLIGCVLLLGAFLFLTYRGLDVARRSKSTYGNLLAVGISSIIGMQALINVAVVSASIPATGVPMPFISYGGSSLISMLIAAGLLLSVSRQVNVELEERELYENSIDGRGHGRSHISRNKRGSSSSRSRSGSRAAVRR
ncbi:putative lipid II flippase FtsW [bacterium]|nr:putative lipid II flippase FtsW [bacterium]